MINRFINEVEEMNTNKLFIFVAMTLLVCQIVIASAPDLQFFILNQEPDPAKAGGMVEVRLRIQNTGDAEAKNFFVEAVPQYPFSLLTGEETQQTIASLPSFPDTENSKTISYKFRVDRDATEGQYPIKFRHSLNKGMAWFMHDFTIDLTAREYAQIFSIDKIKIMPGKETDMTFTITNVGNAPLQNMVFFWQEPNGIILPVGTDNTRYIKYLEPDESIPLKYKVIASVNAKPDLYTLNLNLKYDTKSTNGSSVKETITTTTGIFVGGETDFDIAFSESTAGQTSLSVSNVGSNPAYSVTVRVPQQEGYAVRGSTDTIIGNLDKGDYTIVSFQIAQNAVQRTQTTATADSQQQTRQRLVQRNATQTNMLKVFVDYTDTTGVRHTIEKNVAIQFRTNDTTTMMNGRFSRTAQTTSWWSNTTLWAVMIIIVIGIVLYKKPAIREKIIRAIKRKK